MFTFVFIFFTYRLALEVSFWHRQENWLCRHTNSQRYLFHIGFYLLFSKLLFSSPFWQMHHSYFSLILCFMSLSFISSKGHRPFSRFAYLHANRRRADGRTIQRVGGKSWYVFLFLFPQTFEDCHFNEDFQHCYLMNIVWIDRAKKIHKFF